MTRSELLAKALALPLRSGVYIMRSAPPTGKKGAAVAENTAESISATPATPKGIEGAAVTESIPPKEIKGSDIVDKTDKPLDEEKKLGKIIYVGKSRSLKNRVSQYFQNSTSADTEMPFGQKTARMVAQVCDFDYILTDNEMEALTLENSLIKLHKPRYNIKLKDDKSYPYIRLDMRSEFPTLVVERRRVSDGAMWFGPYSGTSVAWGIVAAARKIFRVPSCKHVFPRDVGKIRPCIYADIGRCVAPCAGKISSAEYREIYTEITRFLRGNFTGVKRNLTERMNSASEALAFEAALRLRDEIAALDALYNKQKVVGESDVEHDVVALHDDGRNACLAVSFIREGALIDTECHHLDDEGILDEEALISLLCSLYAHREYIPSEILHNLPLSGDAERQISDYLASRGARTALHKPQRGDKKKLVDMVGDTAKLYAEQHGKEREKEDTAALRLAALASLEVVPEEIEAIDISNMGDEHIKAGIVRFIRGKPCKNLYRTYNINLSERDDYASMANAVSRRLDHIDKNPLPDLLLLDGGAGHVSVIKNLLAERGISLPVLGMVKDDFHKTRALTDGDGEISIAGERGVYGLIFRIQEEVHRFVHLRMSNAKSKSLTTSELTKIDGIGAARAKALLAKFGGIRGVKAADIEKLCEVRGITPEIARRIKSHE